MSKKLKAWLDQYGAEHFGRLIFATIRKTVGLKGLKYGFTGTSEITRCTRLVHNSVVRVSEATFFLQHWTALWTPLCALVQVMARLRCESHISSSSQWSINLHSAAALCLIHNLNTKMSLTRSTVNNDAMLSAEYRPTVLLTDTLFSCSLNRCAFSNAYNKPRTR